MISLIIGIFATVVLLSVIFGLIGVVFSLLYKFLGALIIVGIVAWIIDWLCGGRLFRTGRNYHNCHYNSRRHRDWYVVNKKNRRNFDDHDEWSDF